jgi:hypothetical protein
MATKVMVQRHQGTIRLVTEDSVPGIPNEVVSRHTDLGLLSSLLLATGLLTQVIALLQEAAQKRGSAPQTAPQSEQAPIPGGVGE